PEIAKTAVHALEWDLTLPKEKIKISVEKGKLTLTGEVEWWYQKENAEKDVQDLPGVVSVDNQIGVRPTMPITNAIEVKAKIKDEFGRSALIDAENINVEVDGTIVLLKGHVRSWAEFKEAADVAWSIPGITHVDNQIIIGI
ncbi:MAG: BON domain-containing protein, partial [Burkholderiales bacterium]